jgi:hypothetical protein
LITYVEMNREQFQRSLCQIDILRSRRVFYLDLLLTIVVIVIRWVKFFNTHLFCSTFFIAQSFNFIFGRESRPLVCNIIITFQCLGQLRKCSVVMNHTTHDRNMGNCTATTTDLVQLQQLPQCVVWILGGDRIAVAVLQQYCSQLELINYAFLTVSHVLASTNKTAPHIIWVAPGMVNVAEVIRQITNMYPDRCVLVSAPHAPYNTLSWQEFVIVMRREMPSTCSISPKLHMNSINSVFSRNAAFNL